MIRGRNESQPALESALLGLLLTGPLHGYELHRRLSAPEGLGLVWSVKQAQLYAILSRLETRGLLEAELIPQEGKPARRVFRLSAEGKRCAESWLSAPSAQKDLKLDFLAKLAVALTDGRERARALLERQKEGSRTWLRELEGRASEAKGFPAMVYRFRAGQVRASLDWLSACEAELAADRPAAGLPAAGSPAAGRAATDLPAAGSPASGGPESVPAIAPKDAS